MLFFAAAGAGLARAAAVIARLLGAGATGSAPLLTCGTLLAPLALLLPPDTWPVAAAFATLLLAIAWLDQQAGVVHVGLAAPLALLGLGLAAGEGALAMSLAGTILGYGLCVGVECGYRLLRRQEGLGRGDAWVLGAVGAWVGPNGLGPLLTLAAVAGLAVVLLRDPLRDRAAPLPFAPALAAAAWVVWIFSGGLAAMALI